MSFQLANPSSLLSPYIKQYWGIENCIANGESYTHRIIPSGFIEMSFYFDDLPVALDYSKNLPSQSILSGQLNSFYNISISGHLKMFSISFKPLGAFMFFELPLNEISNQNIPLKALFKDEINKIEDLLYESKTFYDKVDIIEKYLLQLLKKKEKIFDYNRISHSLQIINKSRGKTQVEYLSAEACLSRKQFERTFSAFIGLSPKQFIKVIRFQNALFTKHQYPNDSLTKLAYDVGYFDQSHMVNNFKSLSGLSPKQYFKECTPVSDYFST